MTSSICILRSLFAIFAQKYDDSHSSASLLTRSNPGKLIFVPKIKRPVTGENIDDVEANINVARIAEEHFGRSIPVGLPVVETVMRKVYYHPRTVF